MSSNPSRLATSQKTSKTITKAEAYRLHQVLGQLKGFVSEPRHVYTLVMLKKKLQPEVEVIDDLNKPPERIQEFENRRLDLCKEFSSKDDKGNPVVSADKNFVIDPPKKAEFESRIRDLQIEFHKDIEAHQVTIGKINALVSEPAEINQLPKIPLSAIIGSITFDQMDALFPVIVDDTTSDG